MNPVVRLIERAKIEDRDLFLAQFLPVARSFLFKDMDKA
jgi:hypothetical protein